MDALRHSFVKFHLRTSHVFPKGAANQGREKGKIVLDVFFY